jgi:hypothetical protein
MYGVYVQDLRRYEIIRDPKPVLKDQFISSVVEVLQEIKQISVTNQYYNHIGYYLKI